MKKAWLGFDEFFKLGLKVFLESFDFIVQTEFEILKLPKKLDVLVVKLKDKNIPKQFQILDFFKEHNLVSFKSPRDRIKEKDFNHAIIYLHGYINLTKEASYANTTMTILCNHTPKKYLQKCKENVRQSKNGVWVIKYGLFSVILINLNLTELQGIDSAFLKDFAETNSFKKSISFQQKSQMPKKILDIMSTFMYIRNSSFEGSRIKEIKMPVTMKGDITDIVKPYIEEVKLETEIKNAKAMKKRGFSNKIVSEITGLSVRDLKKYKVI